MNFELNPKIIQDMCGTVSYKSGEAYVRSNKVTIEDHGADHCKALVRGAETFEVNIIKDEGGHLITECSCPKLASYNLSCQHTAAVLIAIQGAGDTSAEDLSEDFLHLFNMQKKSPPRIEQLHFETREVLNIDFVLRPVSMRGGQNLIGVEIAVNGHPVGYIRGFLKALKEGRPFKINNSFTYSTHNHCLRRETEAVVSGLINILDDERIYTDKLTEAEESVKETLILPPSSWEDIIPELEKVSVAVELQGKEYSNFQISSSHLPLTFNFDVSGGNRYTLSISGLNGMILFSPYNSVLDGGTLYALDDTDFKRISELQSMLIASGKDEIIIPRVKIAFFLEKVAPHLKNLGQVRISKSLTEHYIRTPLTAKLYLDRVHNKMLAGLEFQYENISINPLEEKDNATGSLVIRDTEQENEILAIMDDSSFAKTEGGYLIQNEELEFDFLHYQLPKLQKIASVYATTAVRNRIFRGNAKPQIRIRVSKERTNWLEFKFQMDGINETDIRELLAALEEKRKYFRLRSGALLSLDTKESREIQRFMENPEVASSSLADGLELPMTQCIELIDTVDGSKGFRMENSFREFLDTLHKSGSMEFEVPEILNDVLRDYQKKGYKWMKTLAHFGFGGILADDMGLGKTIQSIAFIQSILEESRKDETPALIVCPSSLTYNWLNEMTKFTPETNTLVLDGSKNNRKRLQSTIQEVDVVITSYSILRKDIRWFEERKFSVAFFDEAQAFKNPVTQTARAVKKIEAVHRFALTGTPVENSIEELWSICHVVFPQLFLGLKDYSQLTNKTISRRIQPFMLRRMKEDVLHELPKKIETRETVELLPEQKKIYAAYLAKLRHDTLKHLDKDTIRKNKIKILSGITRLRQICCHPALFVEDYKGSSAKMELLMELLDESKVSGRRVLIFSQFTKMLLLIGRKLVEKNTSFFYLDGETPSEERLNLCNRYNKGERDIFLVSLKAGGTGLNLHSADTVILYDTWWNPAVEEQAADRAHRMGQENVVQVIKLVAKGTIEEKMSELQDKKRDIIQEIIDPSEKKGIMLSEHDIREILMI
ncbi:DEAD/DEAH box helicase [Rossellomorea aquimaris]|uniref:Helicase SNF n=1 Tax=Rossellomorea aquimaris TaxID=189382 RepID=A0A1J6X1I4_9BACI|nr:DEAD/DEAH box helicase [Rossellomorea aquimaris]OIU71993.1 helicase SNF [Rossellomorea aquimaris]